MVSPTGIDLRDWIGDRKPSFDEIAELKSVQERTLQTVVSGHPGLGETFAERALDYSCLRKALYDKLLSTDRQIDKLPFAAKNPQTLINLVRAGRGS